jgi:hypothetical protein
MERDLSVVRAMHKMYCYYETIYFKRTAFSRPTRTIVADQLTRPIQACTYGVFFYFDPFVK